MSDVKQVDFNLEHPLPHWDMAPKYASTVTVSFDGAEGGAVWLNDAVRDDMIPIRGPEACRELARLLNAFADGYASVEGGSDERELINEAV